MPKKLTKEQVEARLQMYEEAAEHLEMSVHDSDIEKEQAAIVVKQIKIVSERFYGEYYEQYFANTKPT